MARDISLNACIQRLTQSILEGIPFDERDVSTVLGAVITMPLSPEEVVEEANDWVLGQYVTRLRAAGFAVIHDPRKETDGSTRNQSHNN
jgi:hypothetical protein